MGYRRREMWFPRAIEMWEYYDANYGAPGIERRKRRKATPEEIRKHNQYNKEKICRWKMREHFEENDLYLTLTFKPENRPENMAEAAKIWSKTCDKLRSHYRKNDVPFQWIRNIEVGSRGAWHIHVVLKNCPGIIEALTKAWTTGTRKEKKSLGSVLIKPMDTEGEFAKLAAYMTKTPETDKRIVESSYSTSRNLPVPEPKERKYERWKSFDGKDPRMIPKGWYVDPSSFVEGITRAGYPFRRFQLLPLDGKRRQRPARTKLIGAEKIKDIESPNAMFDTEEKGDKAERDEGS